MTAETTGPAQTTDSGLGVEGLTVRFGGLVAVDRVSLVVPAGRITGLIGPNGAGKTTTFNACSGLVPPASGTVRLFGRDVSTLPPSARARLGIGRTFQRMELYDRLTVAENVALGREAKIVGQRFFGSLWGRRAEQIEVRQAGDEAMELCGLQQLRNRRVGALSTGHRRLVELARVLAGGFGVMLLDEPSSGLDDDETQAFGQILRTVLSARNAAILLVEHNMSLVTTVCEYIYVLDFGQLIEEGTVPHILGSDKVRAAYLGADVG